MESSTVDYEVIDGDGHIILRRNGGNRTCRRNIGIGHPSPARTVLCWIGSKVGSSSTRWSRTLRETVAIILARTRRRTGCRLWTSTASASLIFTPP